MKALDVTNQRFGRLTAIKPTDTRKNHSVVWECQCDCGNIVYIGVYLLRKGATRSCGCLARDVTSERSIKNNTYDLETYSYGVGYTSKGEPFYFDLEDYEKIKEYCWRLRPDGYLDAVIRGDASKRVLMHDVIMGCKMIDHIGGKETRNDNRKENLRIPSGEYGFQSYNNMNKQKQSNNTSGCPGVWLRKSGKWEASIRCNKKRIYLGVFDDYNDAVKARKAAEEEYFGEYSYDNSQMTFYF